MIPRAFLLPVVSVFSVLSVFLLAEARRRDHRLPHGQQEHGSTESTDNMETTEFLMARTLLLRPKLGRHLGQLQRHRRVGREVVDDALHLEGFRAVKLHLQFA